MFSVLATVFVIIVAVNCRGIKKSRSRSYEDAKVTKTQQGNQNNIIDLILSIESATFKILLYILF